MTIPAGTAVFFLDANDEIFKKVQYVDPPTTIYYVHTNAFGFVTGITATPADPGG
jgi:hypothetical protein